MSSFGTYQTILHLKLRRKSVRQLKIRAENTNTHAKGKQTGTRKNRRKKSRKWDKLLEKFIKSRMLCTARIAMSKASMRIGREMNENWSRIGRETWVRVSVGGCWGKSISWWKIDYGSFSFDRIGTSVCLTLCQPRTNAIRLNARQHELIMTN